MKQQKNPDSSGASTMPRRAYSYLRVSGRKQERGDGLRRQEAIAPQLCERHGWQLDDSLMLCDVGSSYLGTNADLGDLSRFLEAVKTRRVTPGSVLIIENLDRLSREEVDDAYDVFRMIIRAGIWIATWSPERIYSAETSKGNLLAVLEPLFIFIRAHEESQIKSVRARANWASKREAARTTKAPMSTGCPPWIERHDGGYRLVPARVAVVRQVITWALDGLGNERIAERLGSDPERYPPWGRAQERRGVSYPARWSPNSIGDMLRDPRLYGLYQPTTFVEVARAKHPDLKRMQRVPEGKPIADYYPSVIDEEEWQRLQTVRRKRLKGSGRPGLEERNLFTGLIRRAVSGQRLQVKPTKSGRNVYHYLREAEPATCPDRIEYESLETFVLELLNDLTPADLSPRQGVADERATRAGQITKQLEALENRCATLDEQIADPETEKEGAAALMTIRAKLAVSQAALVKELKALQDEMGSGTGEELGEVQGMIEQLADAEGEARADLRRRIKTRLRSLVSSIWVLTQPVCKGSRFVHVQIDLAAGGRRRAVMAQMRVKKDVLPWSLSEVDLSVMDKEAVARLAG